MKKELPSGWKEVRLGDICEYFRGLSYNKQNVVDFGLLVLRSNNIQNYNIDLSDDELQFVNKNCNDDILLKKHDIVICMANGTKKLVGKSAEYKGNYKGKITIGAFCGLLRTKNVLLKYILQTKVYRDYIGIILAGTNINNLRSSELLDFTFQIPTSIDEQKRIADILSTFDDLIENLTKLIEKKELYKKGVMQRVLSGEVRFNGFTDEWEIFKLKEIGKLISGSGFPIKYQGKKSGEIAFIKVSDMNLKDNSIFIKNANNYINENELKELKAKIIPIGSIVFAKIGEAIKLERKRIISMKTCIDNNMSALVPLDNFNKKYIFYLLSNYKLSKHLNFSALPSLNMSDISEIEFNIPSLEEQNKIVELLTLIDKDIDNLKQILHLRKLQKKGVMQKLLTGEVRV